MTSIQNVVHQTFDPSFQYFSPTEILDDPSRRQGVKVLDDLSVGKNYWNGGV